MSRQSSTDTTELLKMYQCPITLEYPFIDPVETMPCRHLFERKSLDAALQVQLNICPSCKGEVESKQPLSFRDMTNFAYFLSQNPAFYQDVHFDLDDFANIVKGDKLRESTGERFLTVLKNASNHLNAAIGILAGTLAGRDCLRQKLTVESETGNYFFGNAKLSAESLETQINGRSIQDWLNMTTERDSKLEKIRTTRQAAARARLFASRGAGSAAAGDRPYSDVINPLLQDLVYGEESKVKEALEAVKDNAAQLSALLEYTGSVQDYSGRTIAGMTLLQAAAAAGDVEMCQMLKDYIEPDEFTAQLVELFPGGIEAQYAELQQQVFNFGSIIEAITSATPDELEAALNKEGAGFTQTESARPKSDGQLTLVEALNRFREQFSNLSKSETIFNPYHLLRAYEAYNAFWDQCQRDGSDTGYTKRDLFWRQMVGYVQRFVPTCYAQAFVQGLWYLVKVEGYQDGDWHPKALERSLKFKLDPGAYFSVADSPAGMRCSGCGFDFAIYAPRGRGLRGAPAWRGVGRSVGRGRFFKNFCRAKTADFQNIMPAEQYQPHTHDKRPCVIQ